MLKFAYWFCRALLKLLKSLDCMTCLVNTARRIENDSDFMEDSRSRKFTKPQNKTAIYNVKV